MIFLEIEIQTTKTDTIISEIEIAYVSNLTHAWWGGVKKNIIF